VHRPDLTIATEDHNVPTTDIDKPIADPVSRAQVETLRRNCAEFGVRLTRWATPSRASCTSSGRSWA
jgi:3-isopropylmalate/(R)-2-methylmalate dehydratase large subunit